jgi:serine/threonine protein kinase/tetratricopeptide (TPR) repeat protein
MLLPLRPEVEAAFAASLELPDAEQLAFLRREYPNNPALWTEVEALLNEYRIAGSFLEPGNRAPVSRVQEWVHPLLPNALGHYRIHRLLGEGSMGAVYEAEQEQPRRKVALKVIKPGLASPELLRRFELESEALGRLCHPGIAQIYEAGTADNGFGPQPYFAMEFIGGEPLAAYVESHQLKSRQRLEVVAKICESVHHAHQRGIIHRDLKPGNIMMDEHGQPKILDFGVARVTDSDANATRQTDAGRLVGTLAYMSPEQVLADPLELDIRSDVYTLGVILFELLARRLPYQLTRQLHEAARIIREEEPAWLGSIDRAYQGDIETIVAKALEKDKARRYSSAADLGVDIQRYLDDQPIAARRPTTTYHLCKFARRNKVLVSGIAAVFVMLIAGIVSSTWEATRARRAESVALTQAATTTAINDFLENDLLAQASANAQAGPGTRADPDLKVRTVLDRAAAHITGKFEKQPLVEASIRQTIGNAYSDLGLLSDAQRQIERAQFLRRTILGPEHRDTLRTMHDLADLCQTQGRYADAEALYLKVLESQRRRLGEEDPDTIDTMHELAVLYRNQGRYQQAEQLLIRTLELQHRVLGEENPNTLIGMNSLAVLYRRQGKYAQAEPLYTKALEIQRRVLGEEHPDTLISMNNLAVLYKLQGKYGEAEPLYGKVLEARRHLLGEEHPSALISMHNLALLYVDQQKYTRAEELFKRVLDVRRRTLGEKHPNTLDSMNDLGALYLTQARYAQAEVLFSEVLELRRRVLGEEHPDTLNTMNSLARLHQDQGDFGKAEPLFSHALEARQRVLGPQHPDTLETAARLRRLYLDQGKPELAERLLHEAGQNTP